MKSKLPKGWDENRVKTVLSHYEKQTQEEATEEDEDAFKNRTQTAMEIPVQLVSTVRELIAKHQKLQKTTAENTS